MDAAKTFVWLCVLHGLAFSHSHHFVNTPKLLRFLYICCFHLLLLKSDMWLKQNTSLLKSLDVIYEFFWHNPTKLLNAKLQVINLKVFRCSFAANAHA